MSQNQTIDLNSLIQASFSLQNNDLVNQQINLPSTSETVINRTQEQHFTIPVNTNVSGTHTIQIPSTSTGKEQSLVIPNFNPNGGPLLCQLDDNSYILIEGLDQLSSSGSPTKSTTTTTSVTPSMPTLNPVSSQLTGSGQLSVAMKPTTTIEKLSPQAKPLPTVNISSKFAPTGLTSSKPVPNATSQKVVMKSPVRTQPNSPRPAMFFVKPSPITTKTNASQPAKEPLNKTYVLTTTNKPVNSSTAGANKPCTNIVTSGSANAPVKYILVPQPKTALINNNAKQTANVSAASGIKAIPFNQMINGPNLPVGTSLVSLNTRPSYTTSTPKINKPIITSTKVNLVVPKTPQFTAKPQPQVALSNVTGHEEQEPTTSGAIPVNTTTTTATTTTITTTTVTTTHTTGSESSINLESTENQTNKISPVSAAPMKTLITYSKRSPIMIQKPFPEKSQIEAENAPNQTSLLPGANIIINKNSILLPDISPAQSTISSGQNRRRKADMHNLTKESPSSPKKAKENLQIKPPLEVEKKPAQVSKVRKVITTRNIQTSDKSIINTAIHELKKLLARRELLLKQLKSSCVNLGKVDYKLTISGSPIDIQEMYTRLASFQKEYEANLKTLDWAVSAMHKLYSELSPKDGMRTTEEILKDLIEPVDDVTPEDPKLKYERFRTSPKPIDRSRPKARTQKKPLKKFYYVGEEGCPESSLEERTVPDKDPKDGKFHCELCSKVFLKQISLSKHLEFDHPVSLELEKKLAKRSRSRSPKKAHCCTDCDKSFHSNIMLLIHRANEHHDINDSYELSRESRTQSRRSLFDYRTIQEESEVKLSKTENPTQSKAGRPKRTPKFRSGKTDLSSLRSTNLSRSNSPESCHSFKESDIFDPDVPIECTDENPIILLKPLSKRLIQYYTKRK